MAYLTKKHKTKLPWQHGSFRCCGTTFIGYCVKRSIASTVCKNLSKLTYQKGLKEKEQYARAQILEEFNNIKKLYTLSSPFDDRHSKIDRICDYIEKREKELKEVKQ